MCVDIGLVLQTGAWLGEDEDNETWDLEQRVPVFEY